MPAERVPPKLHRGIPSGRRRPACKHAAQAASAFTPQFGSRAIRASPITVIGASPSARSRSSACGAGGQRRSPVPISTGGAPTPKVPQQRELPTSASPTLPTSPQAPGMRGLRQGLPGRCGMLRRPQMATFSPRVPPASPLGLNRRAIASGAGASGRHSPASSRKQMQQMHQMHAIEASLPPNGAHVVFPLLSVSVVAVPSVAIEPYLPSVTRPNQIGDAHNPPSSTPNLCQAGQAVAAPRAVQRKATPHVPSLAPRQP